MARKADVLIFDGKPFEVGRIYTIEEMPAQAQRDAEAHFGENASHRPMSASFGYRFTILSQRQLMETLNYEYPHAVKEMMSDPYIKDLARDIRRHGLDTPPVGHEGKHRLLALAKIGAGAPYFVMEPLLRSPKS